MKKLKVLELFAGIGAPRKALTNLGIEGEYEPVEIEDAVVKAYNAIHNDCVIPTSVVGYEPKEKEVDLLFHGSPCQGFSIVGQKEGIEAKHSGLLWESMRIIDSIKPQIVIWENVANVAKGKHKETFEFYLNYLEELGYANFCKVLNAEDYGIPQRRNRMFVVSILKHFSKHNITDFEFPKVKIKNKTIFDFLDNSIQHTWRKERTSGIFGNAVKKELKDQFKRDKMIINKEVAYTITTNAYRRVGDANWIADTQDRNIVVKDFLENEKYKDINIRPLKSKEAYSLMGFDALDWEKAKEVCSETDLYKQAGNSIVVPILEGIFNNLFIDNEY